MTTLRLIYFVAASIGLVVNILELREALRVYRSLVLARLNGVRQVMATMHVREEKIRVAIQACLFLVAVISMVTATSGTVVVYGGDQWRGVAILAHICAVVMLAVKSVVIRRDRLVIMNILHAMYADKDQES